MPSNINPNIPVAGADLDAEPLKDNFKAAHDEIVALQGSVSTAQTTATTAQTTATNAATTAGTANTTAGNANTAATQAQNLANGALLRTGGIMTGDLTLPANASPGANLAITRNYLDTRINEVQSVSGGVPEAPSDGYFVRRQNNWYDMRIDVTNNLADQAITCNLSELQANLNGLPRYLNRNVNITVNAGTFAGIITIENFAGPGRIQILGPDTIGAATHNVQQVIVRNCNLREIYIRGIRTTLTTAVTKFSVTNCNGLITFRRCTADTGSGFNSTNNFGFSAENNLAGLVFCDSCTATNQQRAFTTLVGGTMRVGNARGSGNYYAYYPIENSLMYIYGHGVGTQYSGEQYYVYPRWAGGMFLPDQTARLSIENETWPRAITWMRSEWGDMRLGIAPGGSHWPGLGVCWYMPDNTYTWCDPKYPPAYFEDGISISVGMTGSNQGIDPEAPKWNFVTGPQWWRYGDDDTRRRVVGKSLYLYVVGGARSPLTNNPQLAGDPGWALRIGTPGSPSQALTDINYDLTIQGNAYKPGGGAWETFSDARLKTNEAEYQTGLKEIIGLTPKTFRYNGRGGLRESANTEIGLNAQEAKDVLPEMVGSIRGKIDYDDEDDTEILTTNQSPLIYAMVNALKEISQRLERLEAKAEKAVDD